MREPIHKFIGHLVEGIETSLPKSKFNLNVNLALKREYKRRQLPPLELNHFRGNTSESLEFLTITREGNQPVNINLINEITEVLEQPTLSASTEDINLPVQTASKINYAKEQHNFCNNQQTITPHQNANKLGILLVV